MNNFALPIEISQDSFFNCLFDAGENTCFALDAKGVSIFPVSHWPRLSEAEFFSINPLATVDSAPTQPWHRAEVGRRCDANVTAFRNILIELDELSPHDQHAAICKSGIPFSTQTFSGSRSFHYILSLRNALRNADEYYSLVCRVYKALKASGVPVDLSTKNPSRLSRFPDAWRSDKNATQELMAVHGRVENSELETWLIAKGAPPFVNTESKLRCVSRPGILTGRTRNFLKFKTILNGRNNEVFLAACDYERAGFEIQKAISDFTCLTDLPTKEVINAIKSAYSTRR